MFEPSIEAIVSAIQEQKKMASKPVSVRCIVSISEG